MPEASANAVGVIVSMSGIFADCKVRSKSKLCGLREDFILNALQTAPMSEDKNGGPNNLRAWREHMKMTQEELGAACDPPTTGSVISLLEEGERGLSLKWLRRLAPALKTRPGFIVEYDPSRVDTRTLEMISGLEPAKLAKVHKFVDDYLRDGTNG